MVFTLPVDTWVRFTVVYLYQRSMNLFKLYLISALIFAVELEKYKNIALFVLSVQRFPVHPLMHSQWKPVSVPVHVPCLHGLGLQWSISETHLEVN